MVTMRPDISGIVRVFSEGVTTPELLQDSLRVLCARLGDVFGATRVELWRHDRGARQLVLTAAAGAAGFPLSHRISTSDAQTSAAGILRNPRAALIGRGDETDLAVPLRGRRRALGALVFMGMAPADDVAIEVLEQADRTGRELSSALENVELLDDVIRSREEIENVFNALTDLVVVYDASGRIVEANRVFAARTRQDRGALIDHEVGDVVGPELGAWAVAVGSRESVLSVELDDDRLSGRFVVTRTRIESESARGSRYVLVARDVTRDRALEQERAALERRLAQSEKLAALGQFIAGIAHELNNPLQGALGHLELLKGAPELSGGARRDVSLVYRETDRAARIVRNLLVIAGSGQVRERSLNVNNVISRVLRLRAGAWRHGSIQVTRELDPSRPRVRGDGFLLQQALLNIVMNAEQAMEGTGRLTVRSQHAQDAGVVRVVVDDSGPGLPPDVRSRLFEPFFTTKDVGQGTGLGLAIAYGIVQAHGGTLEADNIPGGGARFVLTLPAASQKAATRPDTS